MSFRRNGFYKRGSRNFSQGGGGVQIPRRGLTENFNTTKIKNLAIPGEGGTGVRPWFLDEIIVVLDELKSKNLPLIMVFRRKFLYGGRQKNYFQVKI